MHKAKRLFPLILGLALLCAFILAAAFPQLFTAFSEKEMFAPWAPPSASHPLGTNSLGYDILAELLYGTRETLLIGILSSILTLALGAALGMLSAYSGPLGAFANALIHIFVLLPRLVTLIVLAAFFGSSRWSLIALISAFSWVGTARSVRAKVIHIKAQPFIENCMIQGYSRAHTALFHILPNLRDVLLSRFLLGVNSCIMMESTLSFLGFGDLYHPTWGTMINFAYKRGAFLRHAYHYLLTPGLCILLLSLSFYFISLFFESRTDTIRQTQSVKE